MDIRFWLLHGELCTIRSVLSGAVFCHLTHFTTSFYVTASRSTHSMDSVGVDGDFGRRKHRIGELPASPIVTHIFRPCG